MLQQTTRTPGRGIVFNRLLGKAPDIPWYMGNRIQDTYSTKHTSAETKTDAQSIKVQSRCTEVSVERTLPPITNPAGGILVWYYSLVLYCGTVSSAVR